MRRAPVTLTAADREALRRALDLGRQESAAEAERLTEIEAKDGWVKAARFATYGLQCRNLKLRPWECPPMFARDQCYDGGGYGTRPAEVALRRRLAESGLSVLEPDPVSAIREHDAGVPRTP